MTQNEALAILESGANCLLTGAAGTGKTYVLQQFVARARQDGKVVAVTATTGLAATHLNGTTLHAWAGIGVHDSLPQGFIDHMGKQRKELIAKADILVIDEISMLHDFRFDLVEYVTRAVRGGDKPFGGLQVVLCGDFFQLPPVNRADSLQGGFVTSSQTWQNSDFLVCYLVEQYRQKNDAAYTEILNGIRSGFLRPSQIAALKARSAVASDPFPTTTRLLTTNIDVDAINNVHLQQLSTPSHTYEMLASGSKKYVEQLKRSCLASERLELKKGAHVMCIKNAKDRRYVNGSLGIVTGFDNATKHPVVALTSGKKIVISPETWELIDGDKRRASLVQLPLRLAWAITVHKSQGMTLDSARVDLSKAFVEGMGYVALSRVKNLDSLVLDGINGMALQVSHVAKQIDQSLRQKSQQTLTDSKDIIMSWQEHKPSKIDVNRATNHATWAEKLEKMRLDFPNAYMPWTKQDDTELVALHADGKSTKQLSEHFGRHAGSIRRRIEKLLET